MAAIAVQAGARYTWEAGKARGHSQRDIHLHSPLILTHTPNPVRQAHTSNEDEKDAQPNHAHPRVTDGAQLTTSFNTNTQRT